MHGYGIWVVECARATAFPRSAIHAFAHNTGTIELPFGYVVCRSADRVVLLDCGFDPDGRGGRLAAARGLEGLVPLGRSLAALELAPEDVTNVVLTHAHWDHVGALAQLPNAVVHLQSRELTEWTRLLAGPTAHSQLLEAIDPTDVAVLVGLAASGRLRLLDGSAAEILPGMSAIAAHDTHTPGSQCVAIQDTHGRTWVAAGDCVMSRENLCGLEPGVYSAISGIHGSRELLFALYDRILATVDADASRVIAVHDRATWEMHRLLDTGGVRIAELAAL